MFIVGSSSAKISILIFYIRLLPLQNFKTAIYIALGFVSGSAVGLSFAVIFACKPMAMNWDALVVKGTCINRPVLYIVSAAVNIASDVYLFCLPLPMIAQVRVTRRHKICLVLIFLLVSM